MIEDVLDYEHDLFLQLNSIHTPFADQFMWLYSGKIAWIPLAILFVVILFYTNRKHWKETLLIFAAIALVITFCDQFASGFCKPYFSRFRPTHHPDFMNEVKTVFDYRGGRYGFISSHAANAFGFATLTSLIFKYRFYSIVLFIWAIVTAYSRIYLGVHFITDIIPGILTGLFFGWIVYIMYMYIRRKAITDKSVSTGIQYENTQNLRSGLNLILYALILTVVIMVIISTLYAFQIIPALTIK